MIRTEKSYTGKPVLFWNDRQLCSSRDPEKEASRFIATHVPEFDDSDHIIFLGLGSGYKLSRLLETTKSEVTVVTFLHDEINFYKNYVRKSNHPSVRFFCFKSMKDLRKDESFKTILGGGYSLLVDRSVFFVAKEFYASIEGLLIGRDWGSFRFINECRAQWRQEFQIKGGPLNQIEESKGLLSVKDLASEVSSYQNLSSRSVMLLRELLK